MCAWLFVCCVSRSTRETSTDRSIYHQPYFIGDESLDISICSPLDRSLRLWFETHGVKIARASWSAFRCARRVVVIVITVIIFFCMHVLSVSPSSIIHHPSPFLAACTRTGDEDKEAWKKYDATELVKGYSGPKDTILIDQGTHACMSVFG